MRDLAIFSDAASRRTVVEALRKARPELVLTASPVDYLCDHEAASALVRDACFAAPAPNYHTGAADTAPPLAAIPHLYWMDPIGGEDREGRLVAPDFVVDVAETFERKREMLSEHASQRAWLRRHHGTDDYLDAMERWTRECGRRAGSHTAKDTASTAATPTRKARYYSICSKTRWPAADYAAPSAIRALPLQ